MIYELARDLGDILLKRGYPARVVYGPLRTAREGFASEIVLERDREQPDSVNPPIGAKSIATRGLAVRARVYTFSALDGAHAGDHERVCELYVDAMVTALYEWGKSQGAGSIPFTETRYLSSDELGAEQWPGVVYLMRFRCPRGVTALAYTGEARPTQALAGFQNSTQVRTTQAGSIPETGCGG